MLTLSQLEVMHKRSLQASRRSAHTIRYYHYALHPLNTWMQRQGISLPGELTRAHLSEFQIYLRDERGMAAGGEHAILRGVRAVLKWAVAEELIEQDPTKRLRLPSIRHEPPPAIQPDQVNLCLKIAATRPHSARDRAIMLTLYDTGVRQGELLALKVSDVDFNSGMITVHAETSKSKKKRLVPFGIRTGKALARYLRVERRPVLPVIDHLFLNRSGEPLTTSGLTSLLLTTGRAAGLNRDQTAPHAWRRGMAVQYLRQGGDMFSLQQILGHAELTMVRRYVRYLPDDLQREHMRASPVDRL